MSENRTGNKNRRDKNEHNDITESENYESSSTLQNKKL